MQVETSEMLSDVPVAAFLLTRGPRSMFGASSGWGDADWRWHSQYDAHLGLPRGAAEIQSGGVFVRRYEMGVVSLDCATLVANITSTPP